MQIKSTVATLTAAVALSLGLSAMQPAHAEAQVDVDITLGGITILYYYDSIDVTLPSSALAGLLASTCVSAANGSECAQGSLAGNATFAAGAFDLANGAFSPSPAPAVALTAVPLDLQNAWAVRAIGGASANTTLAFSVGADSVLSNGAASISITNAQGFAGAASGSAAASVSFADPGLAAPQYGGVRLTLDLSNATDDGVYSTSAGADSNYTIEISNT